MRSTFRVLFYLKKGAPLKNGMLPIMVRITIDGEKVEFSTKLEIEEKKWDIKSAKAAGRTPAANEINLKLDKMRVEFNNHYEKIRSVGSFPTPLMLKNAYLGIKAKSHTMLTVFKKIVDEKGKQLGVSISKSTYSKYELVYRRLQEYIKQEYKNTDLPLYSIDDDFVNGFEIFLRVDKKVGHNATAKMMQKLKTSTTYAKSHGMMQEDPFYDKKITFEDVDVPYLTMEELQAVMEKDIQNARLRRVRDIFVFSCFTGLAYSDTYYLTEEHLYKANDGKMWIKKPRQKTKVIADIPLLEVPLQILDKYRGQQTGGRLLPVCSNQKVNQYLKELATVCGINKELTYHVARYTFATSWKIQCKLPPKTKRFCPLKTFNNAPLKSLDRWGYYYFSLFPSVCSHFTDTFSCQLNPVRRMYNTIHNGICYCRVSDCIIPIVRWQLRGDDDGLAPMSVLYYIEQDGSFLGIKVHKEEVIQYEQRAPFDSLEFRFQCAFYFCHLKRTHKFRSIRIICPYALLAGFIPHCCGKEALPGTG